MDARNASPTTTIASAVYEHLRRDILEAQLAPGAKLRIEFVCQRYGARNTPVREALNRLAAEGLLLRAEQRGFSIAPMSAEDLAELTDTRCAIEALALQRAMAKRHAGWEEALVLAHHRLARAPRSLQVGRYVANPEWERLHREFHRALLSACGSTWLLRYSDELADHAYRYRQRAMQGDYRKRNVAAEHQAILQAVVSGEAELAVQLLGGHYRRTAGAL